MLLLSGPVGRKLEQMADVEDGSPARRLLTPLYRERLRRDTSLLIVAAAVDISLANLLDMEWSLRLPTRDEAERLARYYGMSVEALFGHGG
jgi:hypothetical protein